MKIYFTGSLHNQGLSKANYSKIVRILKNLGHDVVSDHILKVTVEQLNAQRKLERERYYYNLQNWINQTDVFVAETSYPSTINIGHEVTLALMMDKPVICLYLENREPGILQGCLNGRLLLIEYTLESLPDYLEYALGEAEQWMNTRFTMIIPSMLQRYLDKVSKEGHTKSEYIRNLIFEDMKRRNE